MLSRDLILEATMIRLFLSHSRLVVVVVLGDLSAFDSRQTRDGATLTMRS